MLNSTRKLFACKKGWRSSYQSGSVESGRICQHFCLHASTEGQPPNFRQLWRDLSEQMSMGASSYMIQKSTRQANRIQIPSYNLYTIPRDVIVCVIWDAKWYLKIKQQQYDKSIKQETSKKKESGNSFGWYQSNIWHGHTYTYKHSAMK